MTFSKHTNGEGECDRCGFIYKLTELKYEWTGMKVCPPCFDPLPRQAFPRPLKAEHTALKDPRPRKDELVAPGSVKTDEDFLPRLFNGQVASAAVGKAVAA